MDRVLACKTDTDVKDLLDRKVITCCAYSFMDSHEFPIGFFDTLNENDINREKIITDWQDGKQVTVVPIDPGLVHIVTISYHDPIFSAKLYKCFV